MLIVNRATMTASAIVDDVKIAEFGAILDVMNNDLSFYPKLLDKEAYKEHREEVRKNQSEFEDFAYLVQENMNKIVGKDE